MLIALRDMGDSVDERWDLVAERERKIEAVRDARAKGNRTARRRDVTRLTEDVDPRRSVSLADVRELARADYDGPVVSLYMNLSPERVIRDPPVFLTVCHWLRRRERDARQELIDGLPHELRIRLR